MEQQRYALEFCYHGRAYHGWQRQLRNLSVQQTIEGVLSDILRSPTQITGCGRTDTGVHARSYWAHMDAKVPLPEQFYDRVNKHLPGDIGLLQVKTVASDWHARFDAVSRTYRYFIHYAKDPFLADRSFWLRGHRPDMDKMNEAATLLKQYDDFGLFEKKGSDTNHSKCNLMAAGWHGSGVEGEYFFEVTANRFLRNMVRRMTAALIEAGIGRISLQQLREAMEGEAALKISMAVPAFGLHLWDISYPE